MALAKAYSAAVHGIEAYLVEVEVYPVLLAEVVGFLNDGVAVEPFSGDFPLESLSEPSCEADISDARSQVVAGRALEVATAGGHNLLMVLCTDRSNRASILPRELRQHRDLLIRSPPT